MNVCIYLRKSRADEEMEKTLGEGETLSKHRKALLKFAKAQNFNIVEIKEEIVSGENLLFRPKMLELLQEVEEKRYDGVLVMDMQRLGRGDMQDQGVILKTFKNSRTKIITPNKTYDLNNEIDEEYTEFEAFMSRKELKMINRRMQGGRTRSVEDGNYIATNPPLGYDIHFIGKSRTLKINDTEAPIVKMIFELYINGSGTTNIATHLNSLGYKTKLGNNFTSSSVLNILKNCVYIGKISWKKKEVKKSTTIGKIKDTRTRDKNEWIIANAKHPAIINEKIFNAAQTILSNRYHIPYQLINAPVNEFAGVLECGICGNKMTNRSLRGIKRLLCTYKCGNKSTKYDFVSHKVNEAIEKYIAEYKLSIKNGDLITDNNKLKAYNVQLSFLNQEHETLNAQKLKLFDLLERGIYDEERFLERNKNISDRIDNILTEIETLKNLIEKEGQSSTQDIIKFERLFDMYKSTKSIEQKNLLLKQLVEKITYIKLPTQVNDQFTITLYPRIINQGKL